MVSNQNPVQKIDLQVEPEDLLCLAFDSTDTERLRCLIQFLVLRQDPRGDADRVRLRDAMAAIFRTI